MSGRDRETGTASSRAGGCHSCYYSYGKQPLEERLVWELIEKALGQIEAMDADTIMERFNLKPVFKEYDLLPGYYKEAEKHE